IDELCHYLDAPPFIPPSDLTGTSPQILNDENMGRAAHDLHEDALAMLAQMIEERWLTARAVIGFWPANTVGDEDIAVYADDDRREQLAVFHTLRQQMVKTANRANIALADFIAPAETGVADYIGGFAVTTGF